MTRHLLPLRGCTPEPLGNYLKALGVFRLVAEQADPQARAWWKDGALWLDTNSAMDSLVRFLLPGSGDITHRTEAVYSPTPIFAPWGGRPGFYRDGNKEARERLKKILRSGRDPRFAASAGTVRGIHRILREHGWLDSKPKKEKLALLSSSRVSWPAEAVSWFDACVAIEEDPRFGFLYGTGGNEGSADITNTFWELIEEVVGLPAPQPHAEETLRSALFGAARASGTNRTAGQHFPSAAGSPNSGQGFFGSTSTNPWDVILMMEGCVLFAGAITKRLSQYGKGRAAFPFMVDHLGTGEPQGSHKEEAKQDAQVAKCRAEFWMPLWSRPSTLAELKAILAEGRLNRSAGQPAEHSVHALEAIASLGVSRGIDAFHRFALFERRGKGYYVSASLGNYAVRRDAGAAAALIDELSEIQRQAYRNLREGPGVPDRVRVARQGVNVAIAGLLAISNTAIPVDPDAALCVLISVADLEEEVSSLRDRAHRMTPCPSLSKDWSSVSVDDRDDRLARAIAGITSWGEITEDGRTSPPVESIRANLLPLKRSGNSWQWDGMSRAAVWARGASLPDNLAAVLRRRLIDAAKGRREGLPIWSGTGALFRDLLPLWHGEVDERRLQHLIHALALVDAGHWAAERIDYWQREQDWTPDLHSSAVWFNSREEAKIGPRPQALPHQPLLNDEELRCAFALPRVYALLKLCFVGGRLPPRPIEGESVQRTGAEPYPPSAPEILRLLDANRLPEAVETAARKLRAKGYPTIFDPRQISSDEFDMPLSECRRLAGMLLIPVRHSGVLAALAIKPISRIH